jgi:hypothetical protein
VNKLVHDKNASAAESKYRFPSARNLYSHRNGKAILFTGIGTGTAEGIVARFYRPPEEFRTVQGMLFVFVLTRA